MAARDFVAIDVESVRAAWRGSPYSEFWLELRVSEEVRHDHATTEAFQAALAETNDDFSPEWGPVAHVSPTDARELATLCGGVHDSDQLGRWLVALAERFEAHGLCGVIRGATSGEHA